MLLELLEKVPDILLVGLVHPLYEGSWYVEEVLIEESENGTTSFRRTRWTLWGKNKPAKAQLFRFKRVVFYKDGAWWTDSQDPEEK